ncbi:unnamed protein product [Caenorhabditis brenneri]
MTISLLRFPFLVQRQIFEEMGLLEAYVQDDSFRLERQFLKENGNTLFLELQCFLEPRFQLWRIGNQEVPIISRSIESNGKISTFAQVYPDNYLNFAAETLQFLSRLLPKLSLTLKLKAQNVECFRRTMQSVESVEEIKEISIVRSSWIKNPFPQDELVKLVLDESQRVKNLTVKVQTSDNFEYPTSLPFNFDSISMTSSGWISRDHFIKLFMSCKKVQLQWKNFNEEDLVAIFKAWTEGSLLEVLQFVGAPNFYRGKTLDSILEELPGAAPIRNAIISLGICRRPRVVRFGEGKCFLIQQNDEQTTALVCIVYQSVILTTDFKIGKEVDEMLARIEAEEERLRRHPLDENMEAEAE